MADYEEWNDEVQHFVVLTNWLINGQEEPQDNEGP